MRSTSQARLGPLLLGLLLAGCGEVPVEPPADFVELQPPRYPRRLDPGEREPLPSAAAAPRVTRAPGSRPSPPPGITGAQLPAVLPSYRPPSLPAPWPRGLPPIVADHLIRRVIASERTVGFAATGAGLLVFEATGGIFRLDGIGSEAWTPLPTPLPERLRRVVAQGETIVACVGADRAARFSLDGGRSWARLRLPCGHEGARTVALQGGDRVMMLHNGRLHTGRLGGGRWTHTPLPIAGPAVVARSGEQVVVIGASAATRSLDGGLHFAPPTPLGIGLRVRDAIFAGKGVVVAVGEAEPDQPSIVVSRDAGRTWAPAPPQRRAERLAAIALSASGRLVAVPQGPGVAVESADAGQTWRPIDAPQRAPQASAVGWGSGIVAGSPRGLMTALGLGQTHTTLPRPGLDQPLWAALYLHPRSAIGAGLDGGLYRTLDGGLRWWPVPGTATVRFWDLDSPGDNVVVAVGDGVLWRSERAGEGPWSQAEQPLSCQARWVSFRPGRPVGLVGCERGLILRTGDGGRRWSAIAELEQPLDRPAWAASGEAFALGRDRTRIYVSDPSARHWYAEPAPAVDPPVSLASGAEGVSLWTLSGYRAVRTSATQPWVWRRPDRLGVPAHPVGHLDLDSGGALVLGEAAVHLRSPAGRWSIIARTPGARRLVPTGDGSLMVLGQRATTLLRAR